MALGGGTFTTQNKILPGTYINFASVAEASTGIVDRGYAAIALYLPLSVESTLFKVTRAEATANCRQYFGFGWNDSEMLPVREIYRYAHTVFFYNLRSGGTKASCDYCTAKNPGSAGDNMYVSVTKNGTVYNVTLGFGGEDIETHTNVTNLGGVESKYVVWSLKNIASIYAGGDTGESVNLTGGTDGTVSDTAYDSFLSELERYTVNAVCVPSSVQTVQEAAVAWCRKMREERGKKLQVILPEIDSYTPNYEGVIVVDDTSSISDTSETLDLEWEIGALNTKNGSEYIYKYNGKPAAVRIVGKVFRGEKKTLCVSVTQSTKYGVVIMRFNDRDTCIGGLTYVIDKDNPANIPIDSCASFRIYMMKRAYEERTEIADAAAFVEESGFTAILKSIESGIIDDPASTTTNAAAVLTPWVTGVAAGMACNESATNLLYNGDLTIGVDETQDNLEKLVSAGRFVFHIVDGAPRVMRDINSLTEYDSTKSEDFSANQTVRVLDQVANDIAALFGTNYIGKVPNDAAGRVSLWNDICKHHRELERIRAIENFDEGDVTISAGESKRSVIVSETITPVNAMEQLYMTVYVQ